MKYRLMDYVICPKCKNSLDLKVDKIASGADNIADIARCKYRCAYGKETQGYFECDKCFKIEIEEGLLICKTCRTEYPIIRGIPRILLNDINNKKIKGVVETYEIGWRKFSRVWDEFRVEFVDVISPLLTKDFFKGKVILDAGCGQGRFSVFTMEFGAREIIGFDLSNAVEIAYENLKKFPMAHVVQVDIYNPPFRENFDLIYSIGVLHHLPDPEMGFKKLIALLKPGSAVFIWVYGKSTITNVLKIFRNATLHIPKKMMFYFAILPAIILHLFNLLYIYLNRISFTKNFSKKIPLWQYSERSFGGKHLIIFDHLTVPIINFYTREDIESWFKRADLKDVTITGRYEGYQGSSWRGFGRK